MTETQRVSSYALIGQDERILLCRISHQIPMNAGQWTLPGGGLDFGEPPDVAAIREVREETGLEVRITALAAVEAELFEFPDSRMHVVRVLYHAEVVGGSLVNETEGSTDLAKWFTKTEADALPIVGVAKRGIELWKAL